jgi:hypothetical protein
MVLPDVVGHCERDVVIRPARSTFWCSTSVDSTALDEVGGAAPHADPVS